MSLNFRLMNDDELRRHIDAIAATARGGWLRDVARVVAASWPGGMSDRSDRAALQWVRRWRPEKLGTPLTACSCATGRCQICN